MRRPTMALALASLGIGAALAVSAVSAQQPPSSTAGGAAPGELLLPSVNPSRGARHLLRNGWDYVTYQQYDKALTFFREAEARKNELNDSERTKLQQGIERALRGIREVANGMKTEASYARSGRGPAPGALAAAAPRPAAATPAAVEPEPIRLAGGEAGPGDAAANVRASGDGLAPIAFRPTAPAPAEIPPAPEVADDAIGEIVLPPFSSVQDGPATLPEPTAPATLPESAAPEPVAGPEPSAPATLPEPTAPAAAPATLPEPEPEPVAPTAGEVTLPDDPAPEPEPEPVAGPEPAPAFPAGDDSDLPPVPVVEQLPPLPPGMVDDGPIVTPIPDTPPVVPAPVATADDDEPLPAPADAIGVPASAPSAYESPLDLPRRGELPPSTLSPELQREVERIARRQEEELRQAPTRALPLDDGPMPGYGEGGQFAGSSTRLEISRAPSPTEARPIRAIPVPEEFVPLPKRDWQPNRKYWAAAATCHLPLYFQDAVLERYGYSMEQRFGPTGRFLSYPIDDPKQSKQRNQMVQPWFSAGLFAAQIALLPYNLIVDPPWEAEYDLGYYRPGDKVPTDVYYLPKTGVGPIGGGLFGGVHHVGPKGAALPAPRW